jgi:hypothetical protein
MIQSYLTFHFKNSSYDLAMKENLHTALEEVKTQDFSDVRIAGLLVSSYKRTNLKETVCLLSMKNKFSPEIFCHIL